MVEDEIDFRDVFSILLSSKLFISITTIFFILISIALSNFLDKEYAFNIEIHLAKTNSESFDCREDIRFKVFNCQRKMPRSVDLYDEFNVQDVSYQINKKIVDSGIKFDQLSSLIPFRYVLYSPNIDQLNSLTDQIYELISSYDDKLIELWMINYQLKIIDLEAYLASEDILESPVGMKKAIETHITDLKIRSRKDAFTRSFIEPLEPKAIIEDNKIKNALFGMFFGLFVSISISLFRHKEKTS